MSCSNDHIRSLFKSCLHPEIFLNICLYMYTRVLDSYETPSDHTTLQVSSAVTQLILALVVLVINSVALCRHQQDQDKYDNSKYEAKFSLQFLAQGMGYACPVIVSVSLRRFLNVPHFIETKGNALFTVDRHRTLCLAVGSLQVLFRGKVNTRQ